MAMNDQERFAEFERLERNVRLAAAAFMNFGGRPEQARAAVEEGITEAATQLITRINRERMDAISAGRNPGTIDDLLNTVMRHHGSS